MGKRGLHELYWINLKWDSFLFRYNHGDFSDTDSEEDVCGSSSVSLQSALSSSFSACSPRYQRMCSGFTTSPSIGRGSGSTATGSNDNSSCTSPQPQMTSCTELNNSCASLAGHSINQKMPNLNNQFLASEEFGEKASGIISSSFNDNNSNLTLTSSVESSGIASASEVTMDERGDGEGNDSSCYTHSQCTPDECWIMESRSSFLTDKQNSDAG